MTQSQAVLISADLIAAYSKLGGDLTLAHQKLGAIQANLAKVRASESAQHALVDDLELKYTFARIMTSKNALGKLMGLKSSQLTLINHVVIIKENMLFRARNIKSGRKKSLTKTSKIL